MKIETARAGETLTISLEGRLDILGKAAFTNAAKEFDFNRVRTLVFDFDKLDYLSSAGIQTILAHYKYMIGTNKGQVKIINIKPEVFNVLKMSGFERFPSLTLSPKA